MKSVQLKNGTEEAEVIVMSTTMALRALVEERPIAFYELVMLCRDPGHQLFGNAGEVLSNAAMLETDGQPHDSIRNIVLASVTGDGLQMQLTDPRA